MHTSLRAPNIKRCTHNVEWSFLGLSIHVAVSVDVIVRLMLENPTHDLEILGHLV